VLLEPAPGMEMWKEHVQYGTIQTTTAPKE